MSRGVPVYFGTPRGASRVAPGSPGNYSRVNNFGRWTFRFTARRVFEPRRRGLLHKLSQIRGYNMVQ